MRIWLKRLALGIVLLAALYLLAVNLFLATPLGPRLLSRRPEGLRVDWDAAWSRWPGDLQVRGLTVARRGARGESSVEIGSAGGRLDLAGLLRGRVRLEEVTVPRLRGLRYGAFRVEGDGKAAGRLELAPGREVRLEVASLVMRGASLFVGREVLARDLTVYAALRLGPYAPRRARGVRGFDFLSGTLRAVGKVLELPALARPGAAADIGEPGKGTGAAEGRGAPGERAKSAAGLGTLALDLRLDHGALLPGSLLLLAPPRGAAAPFAVSAAVDGRRRLRIAAEARRFAIRRAGGLPPVLESDALHLAAVTSELRLSRLLEAYPRSRVETQNGGHGGPPLRASVAPGLRAGRSPLDRRPAPALAPPPLLGDLRAEGARLHLLAGRTAWDVSLPRASGRLDLPALLRRELRLAGVAAEGAEVRMAAAPPRPRAKPRRRPWSVDLAGSRLAGSCALAFAGLDLTGGLEAAGGMSWDGRALRLHPTAVTLAAGRLRQGSLTAARDLAVRAEARSVPFVPSRLRGLDVLGPLSGTAAVGGWISSLAFLRPYLAAADWLDVRGQGKLAADLRLERGQLVPGSRFRVEPAHVEAVYLLSRATGDATVAGAVEEGARGPALAIDVLFGRFAIAAREPRNASPHVRGRGLRLTVAAPRLDLAHPVDDLRVRLDLPGAEVTDLAFYNAYLPAGSGVEVLSGAGRLRFGLEMETAHQSGRGDVVLTSKAVRVRFQDVELAGALDLRARLASSDLASRRFALDGTRLSLDRVAVRELGPEGEPAGSASSSFVVPPGWWARLELSRGTVELAKPLELASAFRADMKDSGLLLSLFARKRRYLGWFQKVLDIEGVTARGNLRFADGAIVIDPLHAAGGPIELRSRLRLARGHRRGVLLVRYGRLAAGVELRDGERTYRLRRPVEWYESQKAPW